MSGDIEKRGRRSDVEVVRLQVTLDANTLHFLDMIIQTGNCGRNRNDALSSIATQWIQANVTGLVQQYNNAQKLKVEHRTEGSQ